MSAATSWPDPTVDWQLAAAVMHAACCGMGGRLSVNKTTSIPASKLAGPTVAASCSQSTGASGSVARITVPIKVVHWGLRLDFL